MFVFGTGFASTGELIEHVRMPDRTCMSWKSLFLSGWWQLKYIFSEFSPLVWVGSTHQLVVFLFSFCFFLWQCLFLAWLVPFPILPLISSSPLLFLESTSMTSFHLSGFIGVPDFCLRDLKSSNRSYLCFNIRCPQFLPGKLTARTWKYIGFSQKGNSSSNPINFQVRAVSFRECNPNDLGMGS